MFSNNELGQYDLVNTFSERKSIVKKNLQVKPLPSNEKSMGKKLFSFRKSLETRQRRNDIAPLKIIDSNKLNVRVEQRKNKVMGKVSDITHTSNPKY